ncbi:MAG: NnrS family protein [Gammaproteobacteria bacterium]|nr:NnrS family protein [Gammaproteobacteria bacterium]
MLNIEPSGNYRVSLLHLGFRPFFLLAGLFAVVSMGVWAWLYRAASGALNLALAPVHWHTHEMIYGYALAVVAGFLLTAARNWTNIPTIHGAPLLLVALLWLGARVLAFIAHPQAVHAMAALDLLFNVVLVWVFLHPVVKARQWQQLGIVAIVLILGIGNALFYLGLIGWLANGIAVGIYLGLYLIVLLILVMGRRVVPFFILKGIEKVIEKGAGTPVNIRNRLWVDIGAITVMIAFIILEVFMAKPPLAAAAALLLAVLQIIRLYDWHERAIWRKPLLWSLYLAFAWIALGFALKAASLFMSINPSLTVHAFAYGGIGLITLSMMSRVSLGHTGRNVFEPPVILQWIFAVFIIGAVVRVLLPLAAPVMYALWIGLSQGLWIIAFVLFVWVYAPMLIMPRVDGRYG